MLVTFPVASALAHAFQASTRAAAIVVDAIHVHTWAVTIALALTVACNVGGRLDWQCNVSAVFYVWHGLDSPIV